MGVSGEQHEIAGGGYAATVTEVGATLRELRHGERDLVLPFGEHELRPHSSGAVLAPWPNRIRDGRYPWQGGELQLALSEPKRRNAIHGLVTWAGFGLAERGPDAVRLVHRLHASAGYPFQLDVAVTYAVGEAGLTTTIEATNSGPVRAPYGCASHPYLVAGPAPLDSWVLDLPAERFLLVDPDRKLPVETRDVTGTPRDFRTARAIGATQLDDAYTGLAAGPDGTWAITVRDPGGTGVKLRSDVPWVQLFTGDFGPSEPGRLGLAVEPMTCPSDAFRSGQDLVVLEPGATRTTTWTLAAV